MYGKNVIKYRQILYILILHFALIILIVNMIVLLYELKFVIF